MGRELASDLTSPSAEQILPSGDRPSRTSQLVALTRANLDRPHTPDGDPDAQRRLCAGMRPPPDGWLRPDLAARTRFFDEQVLSAIAANIGQIVILGAGYDDRALRFRSPAVRYFELDHPATQADKAGRLLTLEPETDRLVLAPADFREDDVAVVLAAAGHDASTPSLFICEGLLVYLDEPTIIRLLAALRRRCAAGSVLCASLAVHAEGLDSERVVETANARRRTSAVEPWRTILTLEAHVALVARAGWHVEHVADTSDFGGDPEAKGSPFVVARPTWACTARRPAGSRYPSACTTLDP
jgi:methyltransferase (TIGR00027 family)